jgi:UDP-glucose 4-epimerase
MNVLVTGGAGYIGSHAVKRLLSERHAVVVLDNLVHGHRAAVTYGAIFCEADVGDYPAVLAILREHRIDVVMHFAAFIEVGESVADPAKYYKNNLAQGLALLHAMKESRTQRFILSSTAAVYGNPRYVPIDENHPCEPISPYGRTKHMLEQVLADHCDAYGLGYVSLRYFNVAGAAPDASIGEAHEPESHLIPNVLAVALGKRESAAIFGIDYPTRDGTCIRDYIHVEDLIGAHLAAMRFVSPGHRCVYNLGSENGFSVREVIDACRKVTGQPIKAQELGRRSGDPAVLIASSDRIRNELGWTLRYPDLQDIVRHAWQWHQSHPTGYR